MISFPASDRPLVSVIVVTFGRWEVTERALLAVRDHTPPVYEVIVVDNASSDETPARLREVAGARIILNDTNTGFGPAVNRAATVARGRYLCLLNNDAFVEPGWLDPLLDALEADAGLAAVVPQVLNLDGTLQEAGVLVSGDGRTIALGRGENPDAWPYRFPRYVDYGSALCLLVRRSAFARAGGFDPAYRVGYCEDVDLCFRLAETGSRVRYEPRSRVRHVGGASTDPATIEDLVRRNTRVLRSRWPGRLARRPPLGEWYRRPHRVIESRDIEALDRVLVVDEVVPGTGSGRPETQRLLEGLIEAWPTARVTLLAASGEGAERTAPSLLGRGVEIVCDADASWFRDRLLHATAVIIIGPAAAARYGEDVHRTQPQAPVVYAMADPLVHAPGLRRVEMRELRRAAAVWAPSVARLRFAENVAPEALRFLIPEGGWSPTDLPGVLAHLGMAPLRRAS